MNFNDENADAQKMPILLNYGGAAKAITEMNEEEIEVAGLSIIYRAKEKAFSKGLPIYYVSNNQLVAEYFDGRIEPVRR